MRTDAKLNFISFQLLVMSFDLSCRWFEKKRRSHSIAKVAHKMHVLKCVCKNGGAGDAIKKSLCVLLGDMSMIKVSNGKLNRLVSKL